MIKLYFYTSIICVLFMDYSYELITVVHARLLGTTKNAIEINIE